MQQGVRILDDMVVNQIAAGEVVERPASVVKELVENSLDAGATEVKVVIAGGGRSAIEVIDNGWGMSKDDALLAVERFGTSKIRDAEDLQAVLTHGFRGEALPSIASVSRFCLNSSLRKAASPGVEICIDGGKLRDVDERQMPPGTKVRVRNLFFNVPARKKFLRSEATETALIKALLADIALAYPALRIGLNADGRELLSYPKITSFVERVRQVGLVQGNGLSFDRTTETPAGAVRVTGLLSQPVHAVAGSARLRLLVNRRSVRDRLLLRAVRDGYGNFLKPGRYPTGVLCVELPPSEIDINVHPQKTEIRFRDSNKIFALVRKEIAEALAQISPESRLPLADYHMSSVGGLQDTAPEGEGSGFARRYLMGRPPTANNNSPEATVQFFSGVDKPRDVDYVDHSSVQCVSSDAADSFKQQKLASMRFVGQLCSLYLLLESPNGLAIVDMHAAHERVMFYKLKSQMLKGEIVSQVLLLPETVEIPPDRQDSFEKSHSDLRRFGIECELFGENCLIVRALPALLGSVSANSIFSDLFSLPEWSDWSSAVEQRTDAILARLACHSSVRSGRELTREEVYQLLESLEEVQSSAFCPHGRPVVSFLSTGQLESMFGRS